jgi:hypothetical protein
MNTDSEIISRSKQRRVRKNKIKETNRLNEIQKIKEIKEKIEANTEKKIIELNKNINSLSDYGKPEIGELILNIMQTGANDFKEKTGRNMSYFEMREMFG